MRIRVRGAAIAATTAALLAVGGLGSTATAASSYPIQPYLSSAAMAAAGAPDAPAPGMNLPCTLTAAHPYPVVLVNGTFSVMGDDWAAVGPILANDGYCVEGTNFGGTPGNLIQALGPIAESAQQIATLIDQTRAKYHVDKVDLVGHSQGGMLAEYVAKVLGYGPKIHSIVAFSPTTHGTTLSGITNLAAAFPGANQLVASACPACYDQEVGSDALKPLDSGPIAVRGVTYTVIETRNETVVTPVGSSFINEPGVRNLYVQNYCWNDSIDHAGLPYDNTAIRLMLNALSPSTARSPNCWISYGYPAVQQ
ncbi:esterase/lipase family protein [Nocardioides terrisoli]|uniref:esterase/lipase family protein n=1 Tax=Nocardioides terrisoli TaxID=3388267 RepID=UPI00287B86F7|nr:alpha/beta fold hydrolase [Nocardioides marmorisolisilvae]